MSGPARGGGGGVASPCISVCTMMPGSALCAGCFRTLDEIAAWSVLDEAGKRAVLAALPARRAAHGTVAHAPSTDDHD